MKELFLSIIIPVYKVEPYLRDCLDSVFSQDISAEEYEVICIDDGSPDNCGAILEEYATVHPNLLVLRQQNAGVSAARNNGLDHAAGKYIWFVDSDDFVKKNSFSRILAVLEKTDCDCLSVLPFVFADDKESPLTEDDALTDISQNKHRSFLWARIWKRSILVDNSIRFSTEISYCEDHLFTQQALPYVKNQEKLEEKIYYYRLREGSASSQGSKKTITNLIKIASICKEIIRKPDDERAEPLKYYLYQTVSSAMMTTARLPGKERRKMVKTAVSFRVFPLKYSKTYTPNTANPTQSFFKRAVRRLNDHSYLRIVYALQVILHVTHLLE